jgi:hypothetical protein
MIVVISYANDQARCYRSVNQADDRVMAKE